MLLSATALSKRFGGISALNSVSVNLSKGEILGIIGGNGSGKTTLLNVLSRTITPDAGSLELDGESLLALKPDEVARRGVLRVWQFPKLVDAMTPWDHAALGLWPLGRRWVLTNNGAQRVGAALSDLTVWAKRHRPLGTLSYFERKEADYARAIVANPRLLLIDELTSGLTVTERGAFIEHIIQLKARGVAMVIVEHHAEVVRQVADRIMVLEAGLVRRCGDVTELREAT